MVRKVKLDILEIDPRQLLEAEIGMDQEAAPDEAESGAGRGGRFGKILIAGSVLFLLVSVGITAWYQSEKKPDARATQTTRPSQAASGLAAAAGLEHFNNFAVDYRDDRGNYKVLRCDIALELTQSAKLEDVAIRKVIYRTLQAKTIESLTVAKGKKALKEELKAELDQAIGPRAVKQVYFTRFTLL